MIPVTLDIFHLAAWGSKNMDALPLNPCLTDKPSYWAVTSVCWLTSQSSKIVRKVNVSVSLDFSQGMRSFLFYTVQRFRTLLWTRSKYHLFSDAQPSGIFLSIQERVLYPQWELRAQLHIHAVFSYTKGLTVNLNLSIKQSINIETQFLLQRIEQIVYSGAKQE